MASRVRPNDLRIFSAPLCCRNASAGVSGISVSRVRRRRAPLSYSPRGPVVLPERRVRLLRRARLLFQGRKSSPPPSSALACGPFDARRLAREALAAVEAENVDDEASKD